MRSPIWCVSAGWIVIYPKLHSSRSENYEKIFTWAATTSGWRQPEVSAGTQQPRLAATSLSNHITHVLPSLPALIAPSCMVIAWSCYASWSYNTHLYPRPLHLCRKGPKVYMVGRWGIALSDTFRLFNQTLNRAQKWFNSKLNLKYSFNRNFIQKLV